MSVPYQHKETGQVVHVITVDDRHDMASVIIDGHHSTVVWSEFLKPISRIWGAGRSEPTNQAQILAMRPVPRPTTVRPLPRQLGRIWQGHGD